jgi:hypothetical protein
VTAQVERKEVIPSAKKLIKSLRNIGYDFSTAVADLVDNSLEANATKVEIDVTFEGEESYVIIADNGKGMDVLELQEAMRFGSNHDYEKEEDLGKFGLGLKTASFSQCITFIVASRSERFKKNINAYYWDLEEVEQSDKWEITKIDPGTLTKLLDRHLSNNTGTVVIWKKLDRITGMKHPEGEFAKRRLTKMCRDLEDHLGMVFHRFLAGEVHGRNLRILLNGNKVEAWDPYCRQELHTQTFDSIKLDFENEGKVGAITLEPYVLPTEEQFSTKKAFALAGGPELWNRQQGFYIYRSNRMIQCGGIALTFSSYLDDYFNLNISKMQVKLPSDVKEGLMKSLSQVVKQANVTYRKIGGSPEPKPTPKPISPTQIEPAVQKLPSNVDVAVYPSWTELISLQPRWSLEDIKIYLLYFAKPGESEIIERLFKDVIYELEGKSHGS